MTDTDTSAPAAAPEGASSAPPSQGARRGSLSALRLPQLQALAAELGVPNTAKMRKSDLLAAIREHQGGPAPRREQPPAPRRDADVAPAAAGQDGRGQDRGGQDGGGQDRGGQDGGPRDGREQATERPGTDAPAPAAGDGAGDAGRPQADERPQRRQRQDRQRDEQAGDQREDRRDDRAREGGRQDGQERPHGDDARDRQQDRQQDRQDRQQGDGQDRGRQDRQQGDGQDRGQQDRQQQGRQRDDQQGRQGPGDDDDERGGRRRRGRYRDRKRRGRGGNEPVVDEPEVTDDDVLVPVAGILDVLDSYAFIRTSGYLPGPNDVYVSLGQVKKHGLRKGDAVTGAVKQQRDGEQRDSRQKFNALVRLDTVNGATSDEARRRVEFGKLTPLYPQERLRLETEPNITATRIIDLVAPIGKGQRGLIVSPPKAGKTLILQAIANAITTNNPETHLMVVLVDERPEEVTDMQRTVKGEVIASTFDRPADDHTTVAELAIERAKRLVELGHDVVVLLDSITRLGRAYNLAAPASGRILSGGVDSSALYPPKRFFGAARNIENGGSLTILATALVETGSKMDEVIFEEFKGTGNMELRLDRKLADKRVFPAVDVNPSGTRREEILLGRDELQVMWKLRRVLTALDSQQALELLLSKIKETRSNTEFLMQVQKTTPMQKGSVADDD